MAKQGGKSRKGSPIPSKKLGAGKARKASKKSAADAIARLADHPLVTELLAAGAMAAVTAIADHRLAQKAGANSKSDGKALKAAGKAAAAAIGARLLSEIRSRRAKT